MILPDKRYNIIAPFYVLSQFYNAFYLITASKDRNIRLRGNKLITSVAKELIAKPSVTSPAPSIPIGLSPSLPDAIPTTGPVETQYNSSSVNFIHDISMISNEGRNADTYANID